MNAEQLTVLDKEYMTLKQACTIKNTKPHTLYMWMLRNGVECKRVGHAIVVRESDIAGYEPRSSK